MPKNALVYRVLIASPSDVEEERDIVEYEIHRWNSINTADTEIVLLPVRWETHAAPEFNAEPQSIINRDLVDSCDIAVCIFWSRLGTETSNADSGTIEEIDRMGAAEKLIMVYFSNKPLPYDHDAEQLAKVKEFKKKSYPNGLIGSYTDPSDFREQVRQHLDLRAKKLDGFTEKLNHQKLVTTFRRSKDGDGFMNVSIGDQRSIVEDTKKAWGETIIDYLLDHGGPTYGTVEAMEVSLSDLSASEIERYLGELEGRQLVEKRYAGGDTAFYVLTEAANDEAMCRKISRGKRSKSKR